jgi:hypothetical protein
MGKEAVEMSDSKFDALGPLYAAIGEELMRDSEEETKRILLYAEEGDQWSSVSVYHEKDDGVFYVDDDNLELEDAIDRAWESEEPSLRWTTMEYEISNGSFKAKFGFDPFADERDSMEDREVVLRRYFGDKPVHYDLSEFE